MEQNPKTRPFQVIKMSPKYNISTYFKVLVINIWLKLYAEGCEKMKISKLRCHIMIFKKNNVKKLSFLSSLFLPLNQQNGTILDFLSIILL